MKTQRALITALSLALFGCGEDMTFQEQQGTLDSAPRDSQISGTKTADATVATGTDSISGNTTTAGNGSGPGTDPGGDGPTGGGSGTPTTPPTPPAPPVTPPVTNPGEVLVEDGGTLVIPGSKAVRVGVNFEDSSDGDYNDAVLCFTGDFKVDGTNITSYKQQTIAATTSSISLCDHRIDVTIHHEDGTRNSFSYRSDSGETLQLPFRIKSRLEVTMTKINTTCNSGPTRTMHESRYAQVKINVCNTTGN